jgi:hypothetical protein
MSRKLPFMAGVGLIDALWLWGGYAQQNWISAANVTLAPNGANLVCVFLFYNPLPITITKISVDITALSTSVGITANFGLYDINKNLLVDSGQFLCGSADSLGNKTRVVNTIRIPQGFLYFAFSAGDNLASFGGTQALNSGIFMGLFNLNVTRSKNVVNTRVGGVLPSTMGAFAATIGPSIIPACIFEP